MEVEKFLNKIVLGDAIEVLKEIPDESIDLVIVDPPYFISKPGKKIGRKSKSGKSMDVKLDYGQWDWFSSEDRFREFTEEWFKECVRALKTGGWIFVFFDKKKIWWFDSWLAPKYNVKTRDLFVWIKSNPVPSFRKMTFVSATEFIWVGSKGVESRIKNFLKQSEMVNYMITPNKAIYGKTDHPTEKPEALITRFVETCSREGEIVLDPFIGSGTTAVVCKRLSRNFIGIEKNKEYYDMAIKRLSEEV